PVTHRQPTDNPPVTTRALVTEHRAQNTEHRETPIGVVWSEYVEHHPRLAKRQPTDGERKVIRAALKSAKVEGMTQAEVLCLVLRWAHQAPDAAFYRGENDQRKKYLGLSVLLRTSKLADKIDAAVEWSEGETRPRRRYLNQ
ncbi:MAG: hypothetical protein R3179_09485, partial [Sedimenticolaceae bacterium]|nr:hypothetical protein [Sedimenticolaceae bacterium]